MEHDGDPGYVHDLCMWNDRLIMTNGSDIHVYEMNGISPAVVETCIELP